MEDEKREGWISGCMNIYGGNFACCDNKHTKNKGVCNKQLTIEPMLGIYSEIYKHRLLPSYKKSCDMIHKRNKGQQYPKVINVMLPSKEQEERPLFKNLIETAEKSVDFENILEAAGEDDVKKRKKKAKNAYTTHIQAGQQVSERSE